MFPTTAFVAGFRQPYKQPPAICKKRAEKGLGGVMPIGHRVSLYAPELSQFGNIVV